ncbi:MAG: hypothetical protein H6744_21470 [Deltaproteobacteria bacterium]|nr:hypothetical protein [Deltaproteobacteria bacterium]MCB9789254.1 hypothetical protein [Deltaproteobacteria bacterium]
MLALGALLALGGPGCGGGDGDPADSGSDVIADAAADGGTDVRSDPGDLTGRSVYSLTVTMANGDEHPFLDRELTGSDTWYSYGSAGIGTAVAFSVSDGFTSPVTAGIVLDFGKIVGSPQFPVDTPGPGTYPFDATPPAVEVNIALRDYKSRIAGSEGAFELTEWGTESGQVIAGSVHGTVAADSKGQPPITVDGWFHFTIPTPGSSR